MTVFSQEYGEYEKITWQQLDASDHARVESVVRGQRVCAVVYCAVPKHQGAAATDTPALHRGIVDDVTHCARIACDTGARFVVVSTDQACHCPPPLPPASTTNASACAAQVWDGRQGSPYTETDAPTPINAYGRAKADMEASLLRCGPGGLPISLPRH